MAFDNAQHLTECERGDCERCDALVDGHYMACDQCGHWGHQDSDGWTMVRDMVFCDEICAGKFFGVKPEVILRLVAIRQRGMEGEGR